jgi:hypothetical protein
MGARGNKPMRMPVAALVLLLCATASAGPLPPPLEVDLDVARHVVLGTLTAIKEKDPDPAGRSIF